MKKIATLCIFLGSLYAHAQCTGVCIGGGGVLAVGGTGGGGGSMTWPASSGIMVYNGSSAYGSSLVAPTSALVGVSDTQSLTNKTVDGIAPSTFNYLISTSSAICGVSDSCTLSNKSFGSGMVWPTFNQSTTGTAALAQGLTGTPSIAVATVTAATVNASNPLQVSGTNVVGYSSSLPATCPKGEIYGNPGAAGPNNAAYVCGATNTWYAIMPQMTGAPTLYIDSGTASASSLQSGSTDGHGYVNLTMSAAPTTGAGLVSLVFGGTYSFTPFCDFFPTNAAAKALSAAQQPTVLPGDVSNTTVVFRSSSTAIATGVAYVWRYECNP